MGKPSGQSQEGDHKQRVWVHKFPAAGRYGWKAGLSQTLRSKKPPVSSTQVRACPSHKECGQALNPVMLPEPTDSCPWHCLAMISPTQHHPPVVQMKGHGLTGQLSAQGQAIFTLRWHFLSCYLALSCPESSNGAPGPPGTVPQDRAGLRAVLLPSPSFHAHVVSLQRETQWQTLRCGWILARRKQSLSEAW